MTVVTYKMKSMFFDRAAVRKLIGAKNAKALSKAGAFVRTRARSSLRRRKKPSRAGSPPSVHSSDTVATLKNILFAYDPGREAVIVGPVGFNQGDDGGVPRLMEHGGSARRLVAPASAFAPSKIVSAATSLGMTPPMSKRGKPKRITRKDAARYINRLHYGVKKRVAASYPKRPFMGPALEAEAPKFAKLWA